MTYTMTVDAVEEITKRAEKLRRKGAVINLTVSAPVLTPMYRNGHDDHGVPDYYVELCEVEVFGILQYAGWTILASIDHLPAGNVLNIHDNQPIPETYRTAPSNCDHCHTNRTRNTTIIIRNDSTGEHKQIGRNCLAGYLGVDIENYARFLEFSTACVEMAYNDEIDFDIGFARSRHTNALPVIAMATAISDRIGYVSNTKALETGKQSTASLADTFVNVDHFHGKIRDDIYAHMARIGITADAIATATEKVKTEIIPWIQTTTDNNSEYIRNLKTIFSPEMVRENGISVLKKHVNYAVSVCAAYANYQARQAGIERKARENATAQAISKHVGTIGDKITFTGIIKHVTTSDTQWGLSHLYRMTDTTGNIYTWWTSNAQNDAENVTITGTVKAHDNYQGIAQTVLTRCKVR